MTLREYIERCKEIAGDRWDEFAAFYSFKSAREAELTPEQAVSDCAEWFSQ